jgi:CheY-like chemotaxis protein
MSELEVMDLVKQGIALTRAGDKTQARPLLRQAVEQDPANELAWMWLAGAAESPQEALAALERVLALNPDHEKAKSAAHAARLKVGVAAARAHKKARARALLNTVVIAEPGNELAWLWLANVAESPTEAATCLEKVLAINPDNALARSTYERCRSAARVARPARPVTPVAPSAALPRSVVPASRPARRKTVLLVDDDPAVREALTEALEDRGYQVRAAADGYEAVDGLRDHGAPDVIVLAAALPGGLDGRQLCKLLRENAATAHLPMIMLSDKGGLFGMMRGRAAGVTAELTKPFEAADLLRMVEHHCPLTAK